MDKLKKFRLSFGSGFIREEVKIKNPHWEPCIQYMDFTDGHAKDLKALRFCVYSKGRFLRNVPLIIGENDIKRLKKEIKKNKNIHKFLKKLVG